MNFLRLRVSLSISNCSTFSCCLGLTDLNTMESKASVTIGYLNSNWKPYCSMFSGLASTVNTHSVSSFFISLRDDFRAAFAFLRGIVNFTTSVKSERKPVVSVFIYFTFKKSVSGCLRGSFTQISRLSCRMLNWVMSFSGGTPSIQMESICA